MELALSVGVLEAVGVGMSREWVEIWVESLLLTQIPKTTQTFLIMTPKNHLFLNKKCNFIQTNLFVGGCVCQ